MPPLKKPQSFYGFSEIDENNINEITVAKTGTWKHPHYGEFKITKQVMADFVKHFKAKTRKVDIGIDVEHRSYNGYVGWIKDMFIKGNATKAVVEWTRKGREALEEKTYKYFSPEIAFVYEDMETHETYNNVIIGGGITNRPYFKGMKPLLASEGKSKTDDVKGGDFILFFNDNFMPKYAELFTELSKKDKISKAEFSELEKLYAGLNDEEKGEAEGKPEDVADKVEDESAGDGGDNAGDGSGDGNGAGGDDTAKANEAKTLSEANAMIATLSEQVNKLTKGARATELSEKATKLIASEANKEGAFLPSAKDKLQAFFEGLNDKQIEAFNELMGLRAKAGTFNEEGGDGDGDGDEGDKPGVRNSELDAKAKKLVADGKFNSYSEAVASLSKEYQSSRG